MIAQCKESWTQAQTVTAGTARDCKWAGIVELYLGCLGWDALSPGILLAFLAAAHYLIGRRAVSSPSPRTLLPFSPFMAGGALVAAFASQ